MTLRKRLMLMFNFWENEVNKLDLSQDQDINDEEPIEPPFTGLENNGRLYTQQRSLKNRYLSDNPTTPEK